MAGEKGYFRALTIAGSDNSGGAGIQADIKTFSALGCYGMSVITALTAQNTQGVRGIQEIPPQFVGQQIMSILDDVGVDAVKIGMLFNTPVIKEVAKCLRENKVSPVVLDPVMFAKSGDRLLQEEAVNSIRQELFPLVTVVTPNIPEAAVLLGRPVESPEAMQQAAVDLCALGPQAVVVKGGSLSTHASDDCCHLTIGIVPYFGTRGGFVYRGVCWVFKLLGHPCILLGGDNFRRLVDSAFHSLSSGHCARSYWFV